MFLQRSISKLTSCSDSPSQSGMKALSEMQGCKYSTSDEPTVYVQRTFSSTCVLIECVKICIGIPQIVGIIQATIP